MAVKLRKKRLASGKTSLYLDIYSNGQRHYEFLKMHLHNRPRTPLDSEHNKETLKLAESIRAKMQLQMQANDYDFTPAFKRNINFIAYYDKFVQDYPNKDIRIVRYSLVHFKAFIEQKGYKGYIAPKNITEDLCRQFKKYLDEHLNGETPYNYFTKFKKLIKQATKEKLFVDNPVEDIKNTRKDGLKKDILNFDEIQQLANTPCGNDEVKRAFLFSLNTGLRFCDIVTLEWKQIDGQQLRKVQQKTKGNAIVDLNPTALKLLGERGQANQFVFTLPSHTGCLKSLRTWTKHAGIDKHITWHCSRHSFAVNLLWGNTDIKTVSSLLGHAGLKETEKYTRVVDVLKRKAVDSLPEIELA